MWSWVLGPQTILQHLICTLKNTDFIYFNSLVYVINDYQNEYIYNTNLHMFVIPDVY